MPLDTFTGFTPQALTFLRGLKRHNAKPWFEARRDVYESALRAPMRLLIEEVDARLGVIAPEIIGSKRSMFRIHRDVRFSADKSPYKTHAAVWFYHRDAGHSVGSQAAHGGAGFYFHLEPGGASMVAGGLWMPAAPVLKQLRMALAEDHKSFEKILSNASLKRQFGAMDAEAVLTRPPKGYDQDHPAITWLRYKSFTMSQPLTDEQVQSRKLPDLLATRFATLLPLVRWLNAATGLPAHSAR